MKKVKHLSQSPSVLSDNDDYPRGVLLSRKEALTLIAGAGAGLLAGARTAGAESPPVAPRICVARPEMTAGPFYLDTRLERSDIRLNPSDASIRPGTTLDLHFNVSQLVGDSCTPLKDAVVDVWHCDALGVYSGVNDRNGDGTSTTFLRGYQVTDGEGGAHFTTIYPGWYRGRAVHIHFRIRSAANPEKGYEFTSQLFFEDVLSDRVHATEPYLANGVRDRRNDEDSIFKSGGDQLTLDPVEKEGNFVAAFDIAINTGL